MTKVRKNMKSLLMTLADKTLLQARNTAETNIGHIKAFSSLNLPRHRSPHQLFHPAYRRTHGLSAQAHPAEQSSSFTALITHNSGFVMIPKAQCAGNCSPGGDAWRCSIVLK
jgi:hypothetical protein